MAQCRNCQKKLGLLESVVGLCDACRETEAFSKWQAASVQDERIEAARTQSSNIVLSTETDLGGVIEKRLGFIGSQCALGMHVFKDIDASVRDIIGGRSAAMEDTIQQAREIALSELKVRAALIGANAVVAVRLEMSEFSIGGKSMIVMAYGTAVVIASG